MTNTNAQKNQHRLEDIISLIRLLSLFFPGIAVYQYVNAVYGQGIQFNIYIITFSLILFSLAYGVWYIAEKRFKYHPILNKIYPIICILVTTVSIFFTGGSKSQYKFLFIFTIISFTIEGGVKNGLILGSICSGMILLMDLVMPGSKGIVGTVESDIILMIMFLTVAWVIGYYVQLEKAGIEGLKNAVNIDGLTQLYNHHYFYASLSEQLKKAEQGKYPLSIIMMDIDYFKVYNDMHGHLRGDEVLRKVASILTKNSLGNQITARYGGEEFAIILPGMTVEEAHKRAEIIRKKIEDTEFYGQEYLPNKNLTMSLGVASTREEDRYQKADLVEQADRALYKAKFLHKNTVKTYTSVLDQCVGGKQEQKEFIASIKTLVSVINSRDKVTYSHVERVVNYADLMSVRLNLNSEERKNLIYGAYMHDIGKINISTDILNNPKKLTKEEWEELKTHPDKGVEIIQHMHGFEGVKTLILQHHEKYDGTGYPNGLKGEEIDFLARILTIIDSFDAMTSQRPYQVSKTLEQGYEELRRFAGTQFDPELVEIFICIMKNL